MGMRQVALAGPGREPRPPPQPQPRGAGANSPPSLPGPMPLQLDSRFSEPLRGNVHPPVPILTRCQQPGDAVLSLVQGVPEDARRKSEMPPSPEALKQMTENGTLAASEHFGSPWFDPNGGGRAKAWVYMALRCPPLPAPPCEPRQGSAVRPELLRAPSGAGCERRPVRSVHFWALQDQQKPEKAPGMRSCDWPTRA